MKPRLYSKDHSWKYNGYGFFNNCIKCEVTKGSDQTYSLEMRISKTDRLYDKITTDLLIRAKADHFSPPQFFKITKITVDKTGTATIEASHIKDSFFNNMLRAGATTDKVSDISLYGSPFDVNNTIITNALMHKNWKDANDVEHSFSSIITLVGYSNVGLGSVTVKPPCTFEELYLGDDGFIKVFGGEFIYDNEKVYLYDKYGELKPIKLRFGTGLSDYNQDLNNDNCYDCVIAYAAVTGESGSEYLVFNGYPDTVFNELLDALFGTDYNIRAYFYDCSSDFSSYQIDDSGGGGLPQEDKTHIKTNLSSMAYNYWVKQGSKIRQASANLQVTETTALKKLQSVGLYDSIYIETGNGTFVTQKVTKTVYDSLSERYISHEFGNERLSLKALIRLE